MNAQIAALWADIKGWVVENKIIAILLCTTVILALIAWAR